MTTLNIYQKLSNVRKSIDIIYKKYSEALKAKIVSSEDLLQEINQHINNNGLFLLTEQVKQPILQRYEVEKSYNGNKSISTSFQCDIFLVYTWINCDKPEETVKVQWFCSAINNQGDPAKCIGAALTYSEKYFLLKFFNVETSKDDPDFRKDKEEKTDKIIISNGPKIFDKATQEKIEASIKEKVYPNIKEWSDGIAKLDSYYKSKGYVALIECAWFEKAFDSVKPKALMNKKNSDSLVDEALQNIK